MKLIKLSIAVILVVSVITLNLKNKKTEQEDDFRTRDDVIYDRDVAMTFTKSLALLIMDVPNDPSRKKTFMKSFDECMENLDTKYENLLKPFYLRCFEIRKGVETKWNNNIFNNMIMTSLATVRIKENGEDSTCQVALPYATVTDTEKISKLFQSYFHQFITTPTSAKPFITSMYSRYRGKLPDNAFVSINRESGAVPANEHKEEKSGANFSKGSSPVVENKMASLGNKSHP